MSYIEKAHESRDLDLTAAPRGVWLVKVPKYLAEQWNKATHTADVGKLTIAKPKFPGGKPDVSFTLNDDQVAGSSETPKHHKFMLTGVAGQSLSILTESQSADSPVGPSGDKMYDSLAIEGKVIQRAECRPVADDKYMKLKRLTAEAASKPKREVVKLNKVVQNYKPVAAHSHNLQEKQKKKEEVKRARDDKDKVTEILFRAFEKHQYYNVKDLVTLTNQPINYLKEILREVCTYNMKAPHKNMWELKPEYRHYKDDKD